MTGPEHYQEAERLLDKADNIPRPANYNDIQGLLLGAQVHAALALAAATAMSAPVDGDSGGLTVNEWRAWNRVAGETE